MTTNLEQARAALRRRAILYAFKCAAPAYAGPISAAFEAGYAAAQEDAKAEVARLRTALEDFRDHGTQHDLNPTLVQGVEPSGSWYRYIAQMDTFVRNVARRALAGEGQTGA